VWEAIASEEGYEGGGKRRQPFEKRLQGRPATRSIAQEQGDKVDDVVVAARPHPSYPWVLMASIRPCWAKWRPRAPPPETTRERMEILRAVVHIHNRGERTHDDLLL
jgi:hypothetical protein